MATLSPIRPILVLAPFPGRTRFPSSLFQRSQPHHNPFLRGSLLVAKYGFEPGFLPDSDSTEWVVKDLFGKAESLIYTLADAVVSGSSETVISTQQNSDWLSGITNYMETVLKVLKDGLSAAHIPYAYGFAIILLTVLVKAATFPLTKKQVESGMAMRSLQPQIKAIQQSYAGDQERIQLETARLYKLAGINPLAGCLPTLATIPVWIGLYRALSNVADEGLLTEGFFWIPSLAGPTTIAARQTGGGINWLFPFVDGHPPLGWSDTLAYLVLPVLLVVSQYISVQIMQSSQTSDPNMKSSQAITQFLPLMIGYFALSVPSGLSLYWLTNNILSTAQQVWLQKLGGAKNPVRPAGNNVVKEEPLQVQKQVSELVNIKKEAKQTENLRPQGLQPGERFKQIKEQETRKRLEREEEEEERKIAEGSNGNDVGKSEELETISKAWNGGSVTNGNLSRQDMEDDQNSPTLTIQNNTLTAKSEVDAIVSPPKEK